MDSATVGVLRDITLWVWLALLIGVAAYRWLSLARPATAWNLHGQVDARPYIAADALVVAAISLVLLGGLEKAAPGSTVPQEPAVDLNAGVMFLNIMMQLLICTGLLFYLRALRNLNPVELFGMRRLSLSGSFGRALLYILPTFLVVMTISAGVTQWMQDFWPNLSSQSTVEAFRNSEDPFAKAMLIIAAVVVAPIVEETLFRGFVYGVIKRFTDGYFAAVCSALLFAVVHFHLGSLVPLVVLALIFCAAYERTGNLAVPMFMHGFFNGSSILLMIFFPELGDGQNPG